MPHIVALYRYPLKGFTPEPVQSLTILPDGRASGDRVLNLRFADAPAADDAWCRKYAGVVLANTPGLARLKTTYDHETQQLKIMHGERVLVDERLEGAGRQRIVDALTAYVDDLEENPLRGRPERLPLKLVGDGITPRYQDNDAGQVTLHSRETITSAAQALGDPDLNDHRFRHNIVIEGVTAWEELSWLGKRLRIGAVEMDVVKPKTRCLATHANPATGERDLMVMQGLVKHFRQEQPTLGIGMLTHGAGGVVRIGDEISVIS
ncbi:MAG: MOSC domain-containing protein [Burkholderiales bacterium]|nr:MOSC domain-containing protein [Burkholderiales bacterium]